jgi:thymidylate synthase (FAD)
MDCISKGITYLEELGIPREDTAMLLPLGMETKIVVRMNLRTLVEMAHQRLCTRAYWEFRNLMKAIKEELKVYSTEWEQIVNCLFVPKCVDAGFCREKYCCGLAPKEEEFKKPISLADCLNLITSHWDNLSEEHQQMLCELIAGDKQNN